MIREKRYISKFKEYADSKDKDFTKYMVLLHDAYPNLDTEEKENVYLDVLSSFPQTIAYAMLKLSSLKLNVTENFFEEYRDSYKSWLEDVETDLLIGFGNTGIFLTYAKMYIFSMNDNVSVLTDKIRTVFEQRKRDREVKEWLNKKIY